MPNKSCNFRNTTATGVRHGERGSLLLHDLTNNYLLLSFTEPHQTEVDQRRGFLYDRCTDK